LVKNKINTDNSKNRIKNQFRYINFSLPGYNIKGDSGYIYPLIFIISLTYLKLKSMIHKITGILALLLIITSCGTGMSERSQPLSDNLTLKVSISELLSDPLEYDNKKVQIEGVISHVCRHSGDKMRVLQDDSGLSILVMLGGFTGQLNTGSEGVRIKLDGTVFTEVTNLCALTGHDHEEAHDCESTLEAVKIMKAKGLDPNIRTWLDMNQYEII
jgi:hypothetical protein